MAAVSQEDFQDAATLETNMTYLSRADFTETFPKVERRLNPTSIPDEVEARLEENGPGSTVKELDDDSVEMPTLGADNNLTIDDMVGVDYDDEQWELLLDKLTLDELIQLCGNAGWSTPEVDSIEKPATVDIDGPQGLNGFSFNDMGLKMNTHAGLFAAAEVTGMQEQGVYVYAKHYLLNTQDTNRDGVSNWCNEQALREVYARPFEIAIKNGGCTGLMTELGRIGTSWSSATYALCTTLPRDEWGMKGKIITDGVGPGGSYYMLPDYAVRAGTNMMLTKASGNCGFTEEDLNSGYVVTKMRESAKDILYVYVNSEAPNMYEYAGGFSVWMWLWILGDVVLVSISIAIPSVVVMVLAVGNVQILSWTNTFCCMHRIIYTLPVEK